MGTASDGITLVSALGGILPALFWLWFWLKEDRLHPEPKRIIFGTFLAGGLATALVLPLQQYAATLLPSGVLLLATWAFIEELLKFIAAEYGGLSSDWNDEPVDSMIYMATAALGFAAIENTFFLARSLSEDTQIMALITSNLRFLGATLVHVVCSSLVGFALGLSFGKDKKTRLTHAAIGIVGATGLHALFNFFILKDDGHFTFAVLLTLWTAVIGLFLLFERVKHLRK